MTVRLYNTLTRSVDPFVPQAPPMVSLYTCGPTVYNYAHIGNFRTFIFEDVLRRWLTARGYTVYHVMNLTDVDDKTIKGAAAAGVSLRDHTARYTEAFMTDSAYLRLLPASDYPRATDFVAPMVALVESLLAKDVAYLGEDGSVYFAIDRFPAYGRLSRLDTRELRGGASGRTSADEYSKEDARDFVLWKAARPEDEAVGAAWDTPFGRGRPGWHLECSAMALDLIGRRLGTDVLDIHAGGVDLIFPHHEDEIAQSCAHTGQEEFSRVWMHGEFLTMGGTKMSKRWGNFLTAHDLREDGVDAGSVRTLFATTHYRAPADFSDGSLDAAREGSRRLGEFAERVKRAGTVATSPFDQVAATLSTDFGAAMDDDLNTPRALAALFETAREGNRLLDRGELPTAAFSAAWTMATEVLQVLPSQGEVRTIEHGQAGIDLETLSDTPPELLASQQGWAEGWAARRLRAKGERDFAEADRVRQLLADAGWEVRDGHDGTTVRRK